MKQLVGLLIVGLLGTAVVAQDPLPVGTAPPRQPRFGPKPKLTRPSRGVGGRRVPPSPPKFGGSIRLPLHRSPPGIRPADRLSKWKGRWNVEFANGVHQVYELRKDKTATVKTHGWLSQGRIQFQFDGKSVTITYRDNRVERWTPVGNRMVVEHWFPASQIPKSAPVLGIGERAK